MTTPDLTLDIKRKFACLDEQLILADLSVMFEVQSCQMFLITYTVLLLYSHVAKILLANTGKPVVSWLAEYLSFLTIRL